MQEKERCINFPESIRRLIDAIETGGHLTPSRSRSLLLECGITAEDLAPWADFNHPKADSYGRKMIYDGGSFELMAMSWVDGDMAAIHDHGYTQWGAVKLLGPAEHAIFKIEDGVLTTAERKVFKTGDVVAVGHDLIHQMGNIGQAPYLTLHLYGSYERDGDVTADARLYALDEGKVQITSGGVFFALPEEAIAERRVAPHTDFPTLLRTKVELLRRLLTAHDSWNHGSFQSTQEERLARDLWDTGTWQAARKECETKLKADLPAHKLERYTDILHQELRAAAALQQELLKAGLVTNDSLCPERLNGMLGEDNLKQFGNRYLDLVGNAFSLDFPSPMHA
jgi:predicted metal-dependent enzyme (double-stranded beta helix superfamily)